MGHSGNLQLKVVNGDAGYVLEDVPHLTDYIPDLPTYPNPLQFNAAYSVVKQYFVNVDDTVSQKIVVHKDSPRGTHFRRAGPRQKVYFVSDEVHACIVTCGGLCPGLNTVIREIVCGLYHMYGVSKILGIDGGYRGFYSKNTINLTPKVVNDIHKRGGTILGTSRGGHDTSKIVDSIQDRGINQVYIIGGDGTQKGAAVIYEEIRQRGLKVAVAGIPKTIDNDIPVIDKSFGFDTAVEEAQRAINAAHVEAESIENGIGVVKLMGRYCGFIAMYATLGSRDVDCCLIPESPFYLEGEGGLYEFIEKRLKENGHMVIVIAEGAGQDLLAESLQSMNQQDASGNKLLQDVGLWISHKIKDHFARLHKMAINLKYIDPTYMIRAIPSNASDNVYCTLLAQSAVHGAVAGYTGFTVGPVNGRHAYIPFNRINERQNQVVITDRMWARVLSSTNQAEIGIPLSIQQYKSLTASVLIGRLINANCHLLALRISEYLGMNQEVVIMHWACSKITASLAIPDVTLLEILLDKLKLCKGISYAAVAAHADKSGRRKLAAMLVEHEPRSSKQVPLLLSIGEEDTALVKATESGDTDLVYLVIFHIWQKRPALEFFGMIQTRPLACDLFTVYARCYKHEFLKDFFLSTGQLQEVAFLLWKESWELGKNPMASNGSALHGPRIKRIEKAHSLFSETKEHTFESKAAEEHAKLLRIQHELEVSTKQAIFVDSSISDTIRTCIVLGNHRAAMKVKTEFKVSEKRWYWLKVFALATKRDWDALERFSKEKRPPIGYRPFVEACVDADEKGEALKYIPKLADPRERAEAYARIGMAKEAADAASQAKDGELLGRLKLTFAQNAAASSIFDTLRDRLSFQGVS